MNNTKFFKVLHLISSLVAIAVLATGAYFGYGFYKEYKAEQITKATTQAPANPKAEESEAKDSSDPIDWDKIKTNATKDEKEQEAEHNKPPVMKTLAPSKKQAQKQKPKLAIIMDDMAYKSQLNDLQKLSLPITPSFFPVSPDSPDTARLAASTPFYMVHLPLEAQSPQQSRQKWLLVGSSQDEIREQIATIKQDFPRLMFINNHTGSKFTASKADMANLLQVLREFGIEFVDSRTSADTAVPALYKQENRQLLTRDVFLDNTQSVSYTTNQLKQAIKIAKKKGYAIAICHPHQSTFKALANAKYSLFKEVELVYIKDLPIARTLLAQNLVNAKTPTPKQETTTATHSNQAQPKQGGIANLFDNAPEQSVIQDEQTSSIPHNAYLDNNNTHDPITLESKPPIDSSAQDNTQSSDKETIQAQIAPTSPSEPTTPPVKVATPKPSKIDPTIFKEAKRVSKEQETKAKPPAPKRETTKAKGYEDIQDCAQDEVEAFVSGCPSDKTKKKQGFINIEWHNDEQDSSKKPKDFLDSSEF